METDLERFVQIGSEIAGLVAEEGGLPPLSSSSDSASIGRKRKTMDEYMRSESNSQASALAAYVVPPPEDRAERKGHLVDSLASLWRAIVICPGDPRCDAARQNIEACLLEP